MESLIELAGYNVANQRESKGFLGDHEQALGLYQALFETRRHPPKRASMKRVAPPNPLDPLQKPRDHSNLQ
jgi:hypothetical protein